MPITKARLRISDYNENRKARLHKQEKRVFMVSLSLTSMVDMFAILVIFLLSNSSTVSQWVNMDKPIELPKAKATETPPRAASVMVTLRSLYADKEHLLEVAELQRNPDLIESLSRWLKRHRGDHKGYVNIVADKRVPYGVVKRIIGSCQAEGFNNVNLAVEPTM